MFEDSSTRFSSGLDAARRSDIEQSAARPESPRAGWEGFTETLVPRSRAHPEGAAGPYVMKPFDVKLAYLGKPWATAPRGRARRDGRRRRPRHGPPEDAARRNGFDPERSVRTPKVRT